MKTGLRWLLVLPAVVAGSELAHALAYWLAVPDAHTRAQLLAATGHNYLEFAPFGAGLGIASVVVACAAHVTTRGGIRLGARPFAILPALTFLLQELVERLVHDGTVSPGFLVERTFLYGIALQLPFGVASFFVARVLLRAATGLARRFRSAPPRLRPSPPIVLAATSLPVPRTVLVPATAGVRGPPSLL
jgi:hypothetical protein